MSALQSRVKKLEDMKQQRADAQPYEVHSACGRVTATVTTGRRGIVMAKIGFDYPTVNAAQALDLVRDQLPARCVFFAQPNTAFTLEEYRAWIARDGHFTDGSPVLFGRLEQIVH